jgi:hypothetical protein
MRHVSVVNNLTPKGVIPQTERQARKLRPTPRPCATTYLRAIGALALEVDGRPELLSYLMRIIEVTTQTIETLRTERRQPRRLACAYT